MTTERLNALLVLEKGGYTFSLTPAGARPASIYLPLPHTMLHFN